MEQVISDIGQYGTMLDRITTALLDDPSDSDLAYRDRQRQLFDDYETLLGSSQSASYHVHPDDPGPRSTRPAVRRHRHCHSEPPDMEPGLRAVMTDFFPLISEQMAEVVHPAALRPP